MAEFSEVMRQLARMANACDRKCDKCSLGNSALCTGLWCFGNTESIAEAERIVMQWAAEHPEPVYPTWVEWLESKHVITVTQIDDYTKKVLPAFYMFSPIPADIAHKLGMEPKEG